MGAMPGIGMAIGIGATPGAGGIMGGAMPFIPIPRRMKYELMI